MVFLRLVLSHFRVRKARFVLTVAAIAFSVSLVVSVTSGYASARGAVMKFMASYLGTADAQVTRPGDSNARVPESLALALEQDPDVLRVERRLEVDTTLLDAAGNPVAGRQTHVIGCRPESDAGRSVLRLIEGRWFDSSDPGDAQAAVIDQVALQRLGVGLGETFSIPSLDRRLNLKVVGVIHKPGILARQVQSIYVPLGTLQRFLDPQGQAVLSRVNIDLRPGLEAQPFVDRWSEPLRQIDPLLRLRTAGDNRREMEKNLQGMEALSFLGGSVSMLAATFIIFSSLAMGIRERQRTLAMLRAVGAYRSQLGMLVVLEALLLALAGIVIGIPLGWLWVELLAAAFADLLTAGAILHTGGIVFAAAGSLLAALAASLLPAFSAMKACPLEAMSPLARPAGSRSLLVSLFLGLALISIDPILLFAPFEQVLGGENAVNQARAIRFYGHFFLGIPALMLGFFLLSPAFVWCIERLMTPILARVLHLRSALIRQQLSAGGLWRSAGTVSALMVGLAMLVAMQTQGNSALSGWKLPDKFPDLFIFAPLGLDDRQQETLRTIQGIRPGELLPIAIASPQFSNPYFAIAGAAVMPDATMFFGLNTDLALNMLDLDFRQGSADAARQMLKKGRHVLVTEDFRQLRGLGVGDTISLRTLKGEVDFTIAGVVWSPGIDVIASLHDLDRQFERRTAGSLFGTMEDARELFGIERVFIFAANLNYFVEKQDLVERIRQQAGAMGLEAGDVRQIKLGIERTFRRLLLLTSSVALAAMFVAALGVTNTVVASIRSRQWQFGILRSVGVTRGQLLRLVLAEAILLGLAGTSLGLAAGFEMAFNARRLGAVTIGYHPPLNVPWSMILAGGAATLAVALLASLLPALGVSRREPLQLLQAGRSAV